MSRMYDVLTGTSSRSDGTSSTPRSGSVRTATPLPVASDPGLDVDSFAPEAEGNPFVEVGGPGGPVYSTGVAVVKLVPPRVEFAPPVIAPQPTVTQASEERIGLSRTASVSAAQESAARTFPRLAQTTAYLSITFHDLLEQKKSETVFDGPDPSLVALHFPEHQTSGEYRTLRDEIRAQLPEATPRVLMFTASASEVGTTTVLLNLAITIARHEASRVLVIDANINRSAVGKKFALKPVHGLVEVLDQKVPLAWTVQPSGIANLEILPVGISVGNEPIPFGQEFSRLIDQLRQWYDWVLVDCGIWGLLPERDSAAPVADAVYLVSRESDMARGEFQHLKSSVREVGGLPRGLITTRG